jgi:hypothetical protein
MKNPLESTWNSSWQIWIMLAGIVGEFFETTLEGMHDGICNMDLGLHQKGLETSKCFGGLL